MKRLIGRRLSDDSTKEDIKLWPFQVDGTDDIPMIVVNYMGQQTKLAPEEISAMVLAKMKGVAEDYLGTTVRNAIVTVPAHFNDSQRRATINAGTIAGLNVIRIINEPTAAAIAYGLDMKINNSRDATPRKNVLVFDLGGGTLDVSLVVMDKGKIIVKATKGDSHLGGADFTTRMVSEFVKEFEKMHGKDISDNRKALGRLRDASEKAKKVLSAIPQTDVVIDSLFEGIDFSSRITRARFEELNADLFSICMETVVQCLKDAGIDKGNVDDVVLVGGSSRIPMVQQKLEEFFKGTMFCKRINRDEVVAYGAAVYAAILCGVGTSKKDIVVQELTPLALGIVVQTLEDAGNKNSGAHGILGSIKQGCQDFFKGKEHSKSFKPDKVVGTYNKDTDVMMTGVTSLSLGNVIQCLENAGIDKRDLHDVHLDGVRSENPKIHKILQQFSNSKELCKGINPDEVVSHGNAAIFSGVDTSNNDSIRGDITPILIIPRNTTIPTKKNYTYWTTVDFQTHVTIQVYEGKSSYIKDNILIYKFEISGFQCAPKGATKIDISFEIDVNGILNVSVESARLGKQITRIGHRGGLSNNQIQTMIVKAENYKAQDEIHRKIALAKNKVENYANELWDELDSDNVLESSAKKQLKDRIDKTLEWLVDSDSCEASEYESEYADLKGFNSKLHQTMSTLDVAATQLRYEQHHPVTQGIKSVAAASYRPNPVPKASASQPYPPVCSQGTVDSVDNRGHRGNSGSRDSSKNQQQCPAYGQGYVAPTSESDDLAEECDSLTRNPPDNKSYKETGSTSHFTSGSGTFQFALSISVLCLLVWLATAAH